MNHEHAAPEAATQDVLDDLRERLRAFRPVPVPGGYG